MADGERISLREALHPRHPDRMWVDLDRGNLVFTRAIAIGLCAYEAISLVILPLVTPEHTVIVNAAACAFACVIACVVATFALGRERPSHALSQGIVIAFYAYLTIWGIMVSLNGYLMGRQIITFYAAELCLVGFIVLPPYLETIFLAGSYVALYLAIYLASGTIPNLRIDSYILIALVSIFVGVARYFSRTRELERRYEVEEFNEKLRGDSRRDELTGLQNRHGLRESFPGYVGSHVYVIMFDVNHLKAINDGFGHAAGDAALAAVAGTIRRCFGGVDTYRYGGDEFLAIIPETEDDEAFRDRVRDWLDEVATLSLDEMDGQGVSCGYGVAKGSPANEDDLRTLVRHADSQLYRAKRARKEGGDDGR